MLANRLGILAVLSLCILPAMAQVPEESTTPLTSAAVPLLEHRPMKFHRVRVDATVESENWSGYAVTGTGFTKALGSWTVSTVNCRTTPNTYAAFWVGIDGYSSATVEQTGTIAICQGTRAIYYAWYEFYPAGSVEITSVPIAPGNKISAEVSYNGTEFTTTLTNETTGLSSSHSARVRGAARSSAEWIAEAPCCTSSGGILPLADFGTSSFGLEYTGILDTNFATETSLSGPISDFGGDVQEIVMATSGGANEAVPTALTDGGSSFQVSWKSE